MCFSQSYDDNEEYAVRKLISYRNNKMRFRFSIESYMKFITVKLKSYIVVCTIFTIVIEYIVNLPRTRICSKV